MVHRVFALPLHPNLQQTRDEAHQMRGLTVEGGPQQKEGLELSLDPCQA